ncbi:hypothetical protein L1889_07050 [Paenalcaligenes niemegkensis]|uniref:hypothetical protein n=1 Tax=Paenalcaligenes niemegkensis TaxID=2895469 RepID=UPI001EE855E6|nr:hypothetical protein [Paenalcaligenes niemegkensis]MCQ9616496.1 hypothetical protein [Paenalcaligenes niemegkensis]
MRKLLAIALCSLPLVLTTTVYAQGSNASPRGASSGDAKGPGASDANIGGASAAEVKNSRSGGTPKTNSGGSKDNKTDEHKEGAAHGSGAPGAAKNVNATGASSSDTPLPKTSETVQPKSRKN